MMKAPRRHRREGTCTTKRRDKRRIEIVADQVANSSAQLLIRAAENWRGPAMAQKLRELYERPEITFLTNHAHVLLLIAQTSDLRMRELATAVGLTERAIQRIVGDLTSAGYLSVVKMGRRNRYLVQTELAMRHRVGGHRIIGDLIRFAGTPPGQPDRLASREAEENGMRVG
jgi:hypothetical protein